MMPYLLKILFYSRQFCRILPNSMRFPSFALRIILQRYRDPEFRDELLKELYMPPSSQQRRWAVKRTERALSEDDLSERPRAKQAWSVHFLAIAVRLLPPSERDRYSEEFRAELLDVPRNTRLSHALSVLRGALVLHLRRGFKNTAGDAAVRAKD
jgi:hypothetical protein